MSGQISREASFPEGGQAVGPSSPPASEAPAPQFQCLPGSRAESQRLLLFPPETTSHIPRAAQHQLLLFIEHQGFGTSHHRRWVSESARPGHIISGETWPCRGMCVCRHGHTGFKSISSSLWNHSLPGGSKVGVSFNPQSCEDSIHRARAPRGGYDIIIDAALLARGAEKLGNSQYPECKGKKKKSQSFGAREEPRFYKRGDRLRAKECLAKATQEGAEQS